MEYLNNLNAVPDDRIESWSRMHIVSCEVWVWSEAQVLVDFHYIRKQGVFWDGCSEERRWRGFGVELPMVFKYISRDLCDPDSGWWLVPTPNLRLRRQRSYWSRFMTRIGCGVLSLR